MSKKNEVTVAQETALVAAADMGAWGEAPISAQDIVIPRLLLMQGLSDLVSDGKASLGDVADSTTQEVVIKQGETAEFIPFFVDKVWIVSRKEKGASRFEFEKFIPVTPDNEKMEWTEKDGDDEIKNEYALQVYMLNPKDTSMPYITTFKSTSLRTGKAVVTQMYVRNKAAGLVPAGYTIALSAHKEKNDQGNFAVWDFKPGRKTTGEELGVALEWLNTVRSGRAKPADEESYSSADKSQQEMF